MKYQVRQKLSIKKLCPAFCDNKLSIGDNLIITGKIKGCYLNKECKDVYILRDIYRTKYLMEEKEMEEFVK